MQMRRNELGELEEQWSVDLETTLRNLRGEDEDGQPIDETDPRAVVSHRCAWEATHPAEFLPDHLQVNSPH